MRFKHPLAMTTILVSTSMVSAHLMAAEKLEVPMHKVSEKGVGETIGVIHVETSEHGLLFRPDLKDLEPGLRGFHVHENPTCDAAEKDGKTVPAQAAGGHYDPDETGRHAGPYGDGHRGDLPALYVNKEGKATHPVLAPRISMDDLKGRSLMIHKGGDTYSDEPELGGGGGREVCGVVPS
jgi:superoxide dismutase, Cu-Zn family